MNQADRRTQAVCEVDGIVNGALAVVAAVHTHDQRFL